jgi:hypothetical protein
MRLLALHVEDITAMLLDRLEHDTPYALASDAGLAAVWRLAETLRYSRAAELADQAHTRLGHIADAAGSRDVRTLQKLEATLG